MMFSRLGVTDGIRNDKRRWGLHARVVRLTCCIPVHATSYNRSYLNVHFKVRYVHVAYTARIGVCVCIDCACWYHKFTLPKPIIIACHSTVGVYEFACEHLSSCIVSKLSKNFNFLRGKMREFDFISVFIYECHCSNGMIRSSDILITHWRWSLILNS